MPCPKKIACRHEIEKLIRVAMICNNKIHNFMDGFGGGERERSKEEVEL